MGKYHGQSQIALKPKTTDQVSAVLAHCHHRRLAVVPQGGNTGLVGGSVPVFDEIILSTLNMNTILGFDPTSAIVTSQAGCILESLDQFLLPRGHTVPIDLGAKGSCAIGGNVATNAGGLRLLRYGSLHGSVTGLEVVLANGTVLDVLTGLRKDNTGYDVKQLFIGSEGTLGVITGVALACPPAPVAVNVAYLATPSFEAAIETLRLAKQKLGEVLSAFEFLDRASLRVTLKHLPGARNPLSFAGLDTERGGGSSSNTASRKEGEEEEQSSPFYLVVETSGSDADHDAAKLERFLERAMDQGVVTNGVVAQDSAQAAGIWRIREGITEALRHRGAIYKYDVSLPIPKMYDLVLDMRKRLHAVDDSTPGDDDGGVLVVGYGHLGDGNLHLNISVPSGYDEAVRTQIEPHVYEWTSSVRGSVSAEHGLGAMKAEAIGYSKSKEAVAVMRAVKEVLDPAGILNPYKVLPRLE